MLWGKSWHEKGKEILIISESIETMRLKEYLEEFLGEEIREKAKSEYNSTQSILVLLKEF